MTTLNTDVSTCRHCQHYLVEGRRGGKCQQLGTPVLGRWKACQLAIPAFAPSWETMPQETMNQSKLWQEQPPRVNSGTIPPCTVETLEACMSTNFCQEDEAFSHTPVSMSSSLQKLNREAVSISH